MSKMKYMIHSCNKRLWYVKKYLIPSMIKQGIKEENIILWNDSESWGNLSSWLKSCEYIRDNEDITSGIWHLQDDVLLCHDFKNITEEFYNTNSKIIHCGFVAETWGHKSKAYWGVQSSAHMWLSFQCIYIPNSYIVEFLSWFKYKTKILKELQDRVATGKQDDFIFYRFMKSRHKNEWVINVKPNLVEHIDYLIGGSVASEERDRKINKSAYFKEQNLVDNLEMELNNEKKYKEYYYIVNRKAESGFYNIYYCKVYDKGFYNCSVYEAETRKECLEYAKNKGWTITQKLNLFN